MRIGILTSSRADFGIYLPLLKKLFSDKFFEPEIIAFGSHLSVKHGHTIDEILKNGFPVKHQLKTIPGSDTSFAISKSIGDSINKFAEFWTKEKFDLVFALGDRYEMFAAVAAACPFNTRIAHIHAGETTLGAIDNSFRHSISLMSDILFVTTKDYEERAIEIIKDKKRVFNVGALSIDNLQNQKFFSKKEFEKEFKIDLEIPTILSTYHPETKSLENNKKNISQLVKAYERLSVKYQIVITMPNADTLGLMIRNELIKLKKNNKKVILIESFGMKGYLSCMKYCSFLLGNTSSGFVEAAHFPKYVINIGDRQKGRLITPNIFSISPLTDEILKTVNIIEQSPLQKNLNAYGNGDAAENIVAIIKKIKL